MDIKSCDSGIVRFILIGVRTSHRGTRYIWTKPTNPLSYAPHAKKNISVKAKEQIENVKNNRVHIL